jgi:hypothetical protein
MMLPANIELIAVVSGALCVGGLIMAVVAIVGTDRPSRPTSPTSQRLRMFTGAGLNERERRRHRVLLVAAFLAGALAWLVTGVPLVGLLVGIAVPGTPWLFTVGHAEQRAITRIEAVGEWTRRLRDVSGTGQGLQQAIVATVATAPEEIGPEVELLVRGALPDRDDVAHAGVRAGQPRVHGALWHLDRAGRADRPWWTLHRAAGLDQVDEPATATGALPRHTHP